MINFRKATEKDIDKIVEIYMDIHTMEEKGVTATGWQRNVYPTRETVISALQRDDMFVLEDDSGVCACAVINKIQVDVYDGAKWENEVPDDEVTVLHTLAVSPASWGKGYGKLFVKYYEKYAVDTHCPYLRMDTNATNSKARAMYKSLGYKEIGILPCKFNGIDGINLVLLEKYAEQ